MRKIQIQSVNSPATIEERKQLDHEDREDRICSKALKPSCPLPFSLLLSPLHPPFLTPLSSLQFSLPLPLTPRQ